jgi:hypothetical protein
MKMGFKTGFTLATVAFASLAFSQQITVSVNGNNVSFNGQGPVMSGDRVLVPLRGVLEQMGATVQWDPQTQTVRAFRKHTDVKLTIGQNTAAVNGQPVNLDVPASIINGSTMVPLRFVSEALGEDVNWNAPSNTVTIKDASGYDIPVHHDHPAPPPPPPPGPPPMGGRPVIYQSGWVFRATLNDSLDSNLNSEGDKFSVTPHGAPFMPPGTRIDGVVAGVRPRHGNEPGMLELQFTQIDFPSGHSFPFHATLIDLHDPSVVHRGDHLIAKGTPATNRGALIGYGAGAGLIIGIATHRPIRDAALGGLLGFAAGSLDRSHANDVHMKPGMEVGVRLVHDAFTRP